MRVYVHTYILGITAEERLTSKYLLVFVQFLALRTGQPSLARVAGHGLTLHAYVVSSTTLADLYGSQVS